MSKVTIGPRGYINIISAEVGPERNVKVLSFPGRADTGFVPQSQFRAGEPPIALIDVNTGALDTGTLDGLTVVTGGVNFDTGVGDVSAKTFFAIVTDTGAAGISL